MLRDLAFAPLGVTISYQWLRDGRPIRRARASTYTCTRADRHKRITVRLTLTHPSLPKLITVVKLPKPPRRG